MDPYGVSCDFLDLGYAMCLLKIKIGFSLFCIFSSICYEEIQGFYFHKTEKKGIYQGFLMRGWGSCLDPQHPLCYKGGLEEPLTLVRISLDAWLSWDYWWV